MPELDTPAVLVARYLRANDFHETLDTFLREAGLPPSTGSDTSSAAITIDQVLQEKKVFDLSLAFEKTGVDDNTTGWRSPAPSTPSQVTTLPTAANILHVSVEDIVKNDDPASTERLILASSADRSFSLLASHSPYALEKRKPTLSDSPILSCAVIANRYLLTTSMSGKLVLSDLRSGDVLDERRDHQKYVVKVATMTDDACTWIATAAWDAKVLLYQLSKVGASSESVKLDAPVASLTLPSNPEAITFIQHPEIATPVLLISRRDSTFLYYYTFHDGSGDGSHSTSKPKTLVLLGRQNLAPHSNAWIAFTPAAFAISPHDPLLLAVATSAVPHLKLIIVRLLLPPPPTATISAEPTLNQVSQARAELALADREAAAILIHCTTLAPQTAYSTPDLAWRPDASGLWVNGDDGVLRGIEASTGKVVATLTGGHEIGTKIRCVWAGTVIGNDGGEEECMISGGFDRRLVIWKTK